MQSYNYDIRKPLETYPLGVYTHVMRLTRLAGMALMVLLEAQPSAVARPLPFKNGVSVMGLAYDDWVESHVIFAPVRRLGVGATYIWLQEQPGTPEQQFVLPHLTF